MKIFIKNIDALAECYLRYSDLLEKSNKYDCVIYKEDCKEEILKNYKNILLIERLDGSAIWCRNLLKHPHVKTLLKMYYYPDLKINNSAIVQGRHFIPLDGSERQPEPELTQDDMDKIIPGFNFFHYSRLEGVINFARNNKSVPMEEREYDYFFAGTTAYGTHQREGCGKWITDHRNDTVQHLNRLGEKGARVLVAESRAFNNKKYIELTSKTKVILSPFGWGEFCYRDYEGLLLGCRVVKPAAAYIRQVPDVFQFIDWSDTFPDYNLVKEYQNVVEWMLQEKANESKILEEILK